MKISVIIPTMTIRKEMLKEALASLDKQTVQPDEIIVFNGEKDLKRKLRENIVKSKGDAFVIFCDDDKLEPTFIEKTARKMEETKADIVGTSLENFGDEIGIHSFNMIPFGTSLINKNIWKKVGGYDDKIKLGADHDFFIRCLEAGAKIEKVPEPLLKYRRHKSNWGKIEGYAKSNQYRIQKYKKLGIDITKYGVSL